LSKWFSSFDIVVNTWAVTGCFDVQHNGVNRKYAHWAEVTSYLYEFQAKANELRDTHYGDMKIYHYLSVMEEEFRAKAIELCRGGDEVPFGEALKRSIKENAHLWQEKRHLVEGNSNRAGGGQGSQGSQQVHFKAPQVQQFQAPKNTPGASPCKYWNSPKGCDNKNCHFKHGCNRKLQNGKTCLNRNHIGTDHDESKHGKLLVRTGGGGKSDRGKGKGKGKM